MRSLEVVVRQDIVSRTLMILGVLSVLAALLGADEVMGQAHPGVVPGRPAAPATATAPADPNAPKLRCDETTFDFGEAWSGDVVEHAYVIHNDGKSPLEVLGVRSSCGCTVVDYDKVIAPGGEGKVTAKLTVPKAFQPQPVTKTVSVESNDPAKKLTTLTIKGKTKPRVSLEPFNAAFGNVTEDADVTRVIKVTNNTEGHMKLEQIPLPPGQKTVFKAEITEVEPGKVAEIKITGVRPFAERSNSTVMQFNTGLEKEQKISITCSLYSPPLLEASPSLLPLFVPVTREFVRQVAINYNGKEDFKIESAVPGNEQVKLELTPIQGSKSFRLIVRVPEGFAPPSDDPIDIILKTNIQQKPELKVSLKPTRMPAQAQRPQAPVAVARVEDLLGKPTPVTSQMPLAGGQAVQIGTNNQPAVLNFWAAWSSQSRRQLPLMRTLYNLYARKGVSFLNISVDSLKPVGEVLEAARQAGLADATLASDPRYATAARFGIKQVPTVLLIGKNGQVEAVHEGLPPAEQMSAYEQMLKKEIDVLLEGGGRGAFGDVPKPTTSADALESQSPGTPPLASTPKLTIESARQDLGVVKPASKVTARLYYRNDGMQPLTIQSATASEGLAISPDYMKTLSSGAMAVLTCSFDSAAQPGPFEHKVTLSTNDPTRPKSDIVLAGSVRPYLECDPKTGIDFGRDPRKHTMGRLATILYHGTDEIEYLSAECSSPKFEPTVTKLAGGQSAKLVVNPKPPFELGELNATIKVTTTCKQQPVIEVPVRLFVPKRIEVTPEAIVVEGPRRTQRFDVTIANNGLENLSILGVTRSSNLIRTRFYPSDEDGRSYKLEVTLPFSYVPPAGGDNITIRTDDKEFGEIVIPIRGATGG
ncbi:MAG: DUF1573 domain-containing protein [Phycisphaerae bacterium]|nr:DUF1573 domain-containing protein [Phycisphaerae bacterium]